MPSLSLSFFPFACSCRDHVSSFHHQPKPPTVSVSAPVPVPIIAMLPAALVSVYRQYKDDTDAVASWLASTADAAGCPDELLPEGVRLQRQMQQQNQQQQQPKTKNKPVTCRGKGKPRRKTKARAAPETTTTAVDAGSNNRHTIRIKAFVPLAEHIVSSGAVASVPARVWAVLKRVIRARAAFGSKLTRHGEELSPDAQRTHEFFVDVLCRVRDVLDPLVPAAPADDHQSHDKEGTNEYASNRFAGLKVYEPSDEFLNTPVPPRSDKEAVNNTKYEVEDPTSWQDALFAYAMLVQDVSKIRAQIVGIWAQSKAKFDPMAAAIATDTAIDFARGVMADVLPLLDAHGGLLHVARQYYLATCLAEGYDPEDLKCSAKDPINFDTLGVAEVCFCTAILHVSAIHKLSQSDELLTSSRTAFDFDKPSRERATMSNEDKFLEDFYLVRDHYCEALAVLRGVPSYPVRDEFIRSVGEMEKTGSATFRAAFAAQVFLDIYHCLRSEAVDVFNHLIRQMVHMATQLELHFDFHHGADIRRGSARATSDEALRNILEQIKWLWKDPVLEFKKEAYRGQNVQRLTWLQPHKMLQRSPVLSGLMLYHIRTRLYRASFDMINAWESIIQATHLYNALRRERLIGVWADLEAAGARINILDCFVGRAPTCPVGYLRRWIMQMGISLTTIKDPIRLRGWMLMPKKSRAGSRGIKTRVPVSSMFEGRYLRNVEALDWTLGQIEDIIARTSYTMTDEPRRPGNPGYDFLQVYDFRPGPGEDLDQHLQTMLQSLGHKNAAGEVKVTPEQLVLSLARSLQTGAWDLAFPYLQAHRRCWTFLRAVNLSRLPLLHLAGPVPQYLTREDGMAWIVGWILCGGTTARRVLGLEHGLYLTAANTINDLVAAGKGSILVSFMNAHMGIVSRILVHEHLTGGVIDGGETAWMGLVPR